MICTFRISFVSPLSKAISYSSFCHIAVKDGIIEFTFDVGTGPAMVRSPIRVDDGERHSLTIERTGRQGLLELDSSVREYGQSPGILHMLNAEGNIYIGK